MYYPPTPAALAVADEYELTQDQILAALDHAQYARHGDEWQPVLIDDLGTEMGDVTWETVKSAGWYALEDAHWGREIWHVTEKGKAVLAPFVEIVKAKAN